MIKVEYTSYSEKMKTDLSTLISDRRYIHLADWQKIKIHQPKLEENRRLKMAERRMFTKKVTDDDNFMALSSSAQALYLHL